MKKIIFLVAIALVTLCNAQNHPGKRPELLLNKNVKVLPLSGPDMDLWNAYENFYENEKLARHYGGGIINTEPEKLVNRTFNVISVEPYVMLGETEYKIKLKDTSTNEIVFYRYNFDCTDMPKYCFEVIGGLDLPVDFYGDIITEETDKFTGTTTFTYGKEFLYSFIVTKKGKAVKYRFLPEAAPRDNDAGKGKGVILLLEGGKKITKSLVPVTDCTKTLHYCAVVDLTLEDMGMLGKNKITDYRLYKYDEELSMYESERLQGVINYILARTK